jgi:hypothetical protein
VYSPVVWQLSTFELQRFVPHVAITDGLSHHDFEWRNFLHCHDDPNSKFLTSLLWIPVKRNSQACEADYLYPRGCVLAGIMLSFAGLLFIIISGGSEGIAASNPGLVKVMAGFVFPVGLVM